MRYRIISVSLLCLKELELQSEAIKSIAKAVTTEIPGFLSFRGDMHARVDDGFNFIQDYIQSLPFVETLQSFYENNPHAIRMLPLPVQGMIYSRSISHLGVDLIMPVTVLDMGLSLPVVGQGLGMGAKSTVRGVSWGWSKGAQVLSNAGSRVAGAEKLVVQSGNIRGLDLSYKKFISEMDNTEFIQQLANRAEKKIGEEGRVAGIKKHTYAKKLGERAQNRFGDRGLEFEVGYKGGFPLKPGDSRKGSTRLDVYDTNAKSVYDYKFVQDPGKGVKPAQQRKIIEQGPDKINKIFEVNPTGK